MKKRILWPIVSIISCIIVSLLIEIFGFNFNAIFGNSQSSENISFSTTYSNEKTIIKIDTEEQYINKFIIEYNTEKDINYTLKYNTPDLFDGNKEISFEDIFDDSFETSITNINSSASDLTIEYQNQKSNNLTIKRVAIDNDFHFNFTRMFFIFLVLTLICSLVFFYKDGFKTEKIHIYFAIICSLIGTMIIVAQPSATFYSYDDQIHFQDSINLFRVGPTTYSMGEYHLSDTNVYNSAGHNSINSIEEQQAQNDLFNSGDSPYSRNIVFAPTYNKVGYIPAAIGYHLAKIINLPFNICFKIGKLFNLLFYVLLIAYAIKTIKVGKRLLSVIALLPANIFLASEYSYDPAVFIGLTVFMAHLINLYLDKGAKFDFKTTLIMLASISYASFVKAIYAPFLFLLLLIPKEKFSDQKQARLVKTGIVSVALLLLATFILPTISGTMQSDTRGGDTSVSGQLSSVVSHPFDYAKLLGNTAVANFGFNFLGGFDDLAYIDNKAAKSSINFFYIILVLLIFVFITDNAKNELTKKQRVSILLSEALVIVLIWTALYLSFNPVGSTSINGVQNRYFLPLLFPILICFQLKNIQTKIKPKLYNASIIALLAFVNIVTIIMSILSVYSY